MARTVQSILTDLLADKASRVLLNPLTNPSNVAIWYNIYVALATEINTFEELTDDLLDDINERALEIPVGTVLWYQAMTLKYQHGDSLVIVDGIPEYAAEDTTKQVVEVASASEQSGAIIIKAAKLDVSDNPEKLSSAELAGLQSYWINRRFAGSYLSVISQDGDEMKIEARIEVDGSKISDTGESQSVSGTYPIIEAIKEFYRLTGLGKDGKVLNGRFTITDLVDAIQAVDGVKNSVVINSCMAKENGASSYVSVLAADGKVYNPIAGYIIEDSSAPLTSGITYVIA